MSQRAKKKGPGGAGPLPDVFMRRAERTLQQVFK